MLHVYTGDGKGKTTAAIGLAIRALGWGKKVFVIQLLKGWETGEKRLFEYLASQGYPLKHVCSGPEKFIDLRSPPPEVIREVNRVLDDAFLEIEKMKPDLIIVDEINVALAYNIIPLEKAYRLMVLANRIGAELVFTGRKAPKEIIEKADLVTEMRKIKHYFDKRVLARKGIEY